MIYFIQDVEGGRIKIGKTIRLTQRLVQLASDHQMKLKVLAVVDGDRSTESEIHRRFAHLRVVNECFEPGDDLLGFIVAQGKAWDGTDEISRSNILIDADVFSDAKIVAAMRNQILAEYLSEILRPIVHRDLEAEMSKRLSSMKPKKEKP